VFFLNVFQRFCRGGIAGEYNQVTTQVKKFENTLFGKFIYCIKRTRTVRYACIVSKVNIIIFRQEFFNFFKYTQPSVTGIKYTYSSFFMCHSFFIMQQKYKQKAVSIYIVYYKSFSE